MAGASERFNVNISFSRNWEHLQAKYTGTGHPALSRYEWAVNHHRDTAASLLGHTSMSAYAALATGESRGRTRYTMLEGMLSPCGPPPIKPDAYAATS